MITTKAPTNINSIDTSTSTIPSLTSSKAWTPPETKCAGK
jgi:hypothetical protein